MSRVGLVQKLGPARRTVVVALVLAIAAVVTLRTTAASQPGTLPRYRRVLVVGVPGLGWSDLSDRVMPHLSHMAARGAIAAMNVRTLSRHPSAAEAYASLSASTRVAVPAGASAALARGSRRETEVALRAASRSRHLPSAPGALADALERVGRPPAAVAITTGDAVAPVELSVIDSRGRADVVAGAGAASGFAAAVLAALGRNGLVVADATPTGGIAATDRLLGDVLPRLPAGTLCLVVGMTPPTATWELTPVVASGPGVRTGWLESTTTKRRGLVTLGDVAPTVLSGLGLAAPVAMPGHAIGVVAGHAGVGALHQLNRDAVYRERVYFPVTVTYIVIQTLAYAVAALVLARARRQRRARPRLVRVLALVALTIAAFPLATYVWRALPGMSSLGTGGVAVLVAVCVALGFVGANIRVEPLRVLRVTIAVTVGLVLLDLVSGARLEAGSIFGYSLHTSSRFYGLGNTALAVVAAGSVVLGAELVQIAADRRGPALRTVGWLFVTVAAVAVAPFWGAKVGAVLTLVPLFGATLWRLSGRHLTLRVLAGLAALVCVVLGGAAVWDVLQPASRTTHLGDLIGAVGSSGAQPLRLVVARKVTTTAHLLGQSAWTMAVTALALAVTIVLATTRALAGILPLDSPRRTGVIAALAGGLLAVATNDSGAVMVAVVFVYVGPLLMLVGASQLAASEER